jgi:hypothetical protein
MSHSEIVTSNSFVPPHKRDRPLIVTPHMFQDSFSALPGRLNGVGGSATVHAMQALELGKRAVMVAPSDLDRHDIARLKVPAVAYRFVGNSAHDHDEWYEEKNLRFLTEKVLGGHTGPNDVVYAHMPISGQAGMDLCRSNGNPLVYFGQRSKPHGLLQSLRSFITWLPSRGVVSSLPTPTGRRRRLRMPIPRNLRWRISRHL